MTTAVTTAAEAALAPTELRTRATATRSVDRVAPIVLAAVALAVAVITVTPWPVGVFQDDAIYVVLAKALANGAGFRMINMPGAPHATHFPPGYPLFLAGLWKLYPSFPDNIVLFKFANAVFLGAVAFGTYRFSRLRLGVGAVGASVAAVVGTISVVVLLVTGVIMSEPLFMALLIPTLLTTERAADDGGVPRAAVGGALIGVLSLVRTVGVFVLPAALLMLVVRRRPREALALAVAAMAFIVPWQLWVSAYQNEIPHAFVGKYGAYGPWLGEAYREGGLPFIRAVLAKNANSLFGLFGYITLPVSSVLPRLVSLGAVLGVIGLGAWSAWCRIPVTLAFMVIYAGVVLLWPFEPMRFTLVVWPVLAGLFAAGTRTIWAWRPRGSTLTTVRAAGIAAILLVAVGYGWYNARGVHGKWWVNIQSDAGKRSKPIAEWVTRTTQPDEIVVTDDDLIVYLYTGRRALPTTTFGPRSYVTPLTVRQDADILRTLLTRYRPRWYIAAGSQSVASAQFLMNNPPAPLRYAGSISTARIYEPVLK